MIRVLIVDDERAARFGVRRALATDGYDIQEAEDGESGLSLLASWNPHLTLLDLQMPGIDGVEFLKRTSGLSSRGDIVVVTANDDLGTAVNCIREGAMDYVTKPFEVERLRSLVRGVAKRAELEEKVETLEQSLERSRGYGALKGCSEPMLALYTTMEKAADAPLDLLIRGETGTGKELVAREIHRRSARRDGPFVAVNTAAIPESLVESELFGHQRGAFSGADRDREGAFRRAAGGTLFLDEVGDMPLAAQTKILRALQERRVQPVGSDREHEVDVRVLSATHQDLREAIDDGHFRSDLYFRLRGLELWVPPLRERREDIVHLAEHFLEQWRSETGSAKSLSRSAVDRLLDAPWPGNVRELESVLKAASALSSSDDIRAEDVDEVAPKTKRERAEAHWFDDLSERPLTEAKNELVQRFERVMIEAALDRHEGNVSAAARQLGIHRQSLQQKMNSLGMDRERWR